MRVIAGQYRSRVLTAPRGLGTRPTSDRLRETLFNVIAPRVAGSRFADLYAGSGAVGIEAVSRGAAEVWFAERATAAVEAIRANLRALGIRGAVAVESGGTAALLRRLATAGTVLDLVFLDPPYDAAEEYSRTLLTLGEGALLRTASLVLAEHGRRTALLERYGTLRRTRTVVQGDAALSLYALSPGEVLPGSGDQA